MVAAVHVVLVREMENVQRLVNVALAIVMDAKDQPLLSGRPAVVFVVIRAPSFAATVLAHQTQAKSNVVILVVIVIPLNVVGGNAKP